MLGKRLVFLLVLASALLMGACAGNNQAEPLPDSDEGSELPSGDNPASGSQMVGSELIGDWHLASLNGHSLVEGSTVTASFDGLQITGSACNSYFGDYTVDVGSFSVGNIGSTEMFCEDTMEQEQEYFEALSGVNDWKAEGATLELIGDTAHLVFERDVPASDVALEGTHWTLDSFVIGGDAVSSLLADTAITVVIENGQISGNATCNTYSGAVSIEGAGISIGEIVATEMACEVGMEQESHYLATLAEVNTWRIDGDTLTLSADSGNGLVFRVQ